MPRSIWSGAISFGLVNVPVKLYSATSKQTVRFHQLHDADGVRLRQRRICPADGEEVPYEHVVKGYEVGPDRYVVVTQDELDALDPEATRTIDIEDFVDGDEIDPIYYDHPYYLAPGGAGAAKPYRLLLEAMRASGRVAIARVVIRSKQQLCAIRATGEVLTMATMLFGDEVVAPDRIDELEAASEADASKRELDMARSLIDSLSSDFDPSKYHDDYRERVIELIERKAAGEEVAVQPEPEAPHEVPDLMAALEASVAAARERGGGGDGGGGGEGGDGSAKSSGRGRKQAAPKSNGGPAGKGRAKPKSKAKR